MSKEPQTVENMSKEELINYIKRLHDLLRVEMESSTKTREAYIQLSAKYNNIDLGKRSNPKEVS